MLLGEFSPLSPTQKAQYRALEKFAKEYGGGCGWNFMDKCLTATFWGIPLKLVCVFGLILS